jgi:ubiquinone/menaquinone biosynthesis C-methylase UbiE
VSATDETKEQAAQRVFTSRAAFYATSSIHTERGVLEQVAEWARCEPGWLALDVATGAGHTAFAVAERVRHVVATDLTVAMLEQAVGLARERGIANVTYAAGDAHALPFADGTFDLVTSRRAPHHFSRIGVALAEFRRVLRPGGRIVIDDRSVPEDDVVDRVMNTLDTYHDESHVRQYRPSEWRAMLSEAGFEVDNVQQYVRHRPLTSLTDDVAPEKVSKMVAILEALNRSERARVGYEGQSGEDYIAHWFVMVSGWAR